MKKCKPFCDLTKAVKTGEATWICPTCKADASMLYLWLAMAAYDGNRPSEGYIGANRAFLWDSFANCERAVLTNEQLPNDAPRFYEDNWS